ncbi:glycoside hydrolase family 10 protein [Pannus brasiliensis CCIBt3594]|uniref:Glycoside hydrolase family 10 protein n=1 Tax=Pannus brasiliensis CCIBt3594 TaxID=1427578 RepID=A0AAW9QKB4_9CHRO
MKKEISKTFNALADSLVVYSQRYGRSSWLIFLVIFAFIVAISFSFPSLSARVPRERSEIRGVWLTNIDSEVLFQKETLADAVDKLADLQFNTLYPTVWNWGYTLYPSRVARRVTGRSIDPHASLQKRDLLTEITKLGHRKKLTVIPWFEFGFMAPADSELAKRHPDWLTERQDGSVIWWEGKVHQRVWLNPLRPEVQTFITDLVSEIITNYDVDGIQFDDHFGYPSDFGYDDYTVKLYQREHEGKLPPKDYLDKDWIQWRADKITAYMMRLSKTIKMKNPRAIVSLSPNPQTFSLESYLLDWNTLRQKGAIDELVIQVYRTDMEAFDRELSQSELQEARDSIPVAIGILAGLKGRPIPMGNITTQVNKSREQNFKGVSFFFYESLWNLADESSEYRRSSFREMFRGS